MSGRGGIAFYVTSHGFGHLNRSVGVINRIPVDVPVTIRCDPSLFHHWGERLTRPATLEPHTSDVGALNPPGDSAKTDGPATLIEAAKVHHRAMKEVDDEASKLRDEGTKAVVCDATPVPLVAARRAGIPGFLLANFTWADIYTPHARKIGPAAMATVREIRDAYRHASAIFRAEPALAMKGIAPLIEVGMVATPGVDRRVELRRSLNLADSDKLVYFYIGRYGQANLGWGRLAKLDGIHFVGFHPAPVGSMANLHVVPATGWTGADLSASADAIVAKAGYGTSCEAMIAGVPFIYPPRSGFAEHPRPRPGFAGLGRRRPGVGRGVQRAGDREIARPGVRPPTRTAPVPDRRLDPRDRAPPQDHRRMKFAIHPAVEADRLDSLRRVAPDATWINAETPEAAEVAIEGADAFLGKITPSILAKADRLRWVQAFTVSLEHYVFPALVDHPCTLTNMRGLFGDVIADQVMGYVLCFARNLHTYLRRQAEHRYEPVGGESARVSFASGPGTINAMDRATIFLPDATLGIVGLGAIGAEIARRALAFGMTVRGVDRHPDRIRIPEGVDLVEGLEGLPDLLGESDFVVIAAPSYPRDRRPVLCDDDRPDEAFGLPDQHRPGGDRRPRRPGRRPPRRVDRRRRPRRLRDRAAAHRSSALGLPQRHHHPPHGGLFPP